MSYHCLLHIICYIVTEESFTYSFRYAFVPLFSFLIGNKGISTFLRLTEADKGAVLPEPEKHRTPPGDCFWINYVFLIPISWHVIILSLAVCG